MEELLVTRAATHSAWLFSLKPLLHPAHEVQLPALAGPEGHLPPPHSRILALVQPAAAHITEGTFFATVQNRAAPHLIFDVDWHGDWEQ